MAGDNRPGGGDHISAFWDFVPTACELAGANVPEGIDGISYAPTLRNRGTQRQHDHLYWEFYGRGGHQAVRRGRWKAIKTPVDRNLDGPIKLFDLDADMGEKKNLADQHPDLMQDLDRLMRACHTPSPVFRFPAAQRRNG